MVPPHETSCSPQSGSALPWILALGGAGAGVYFAKEQGYFDSFLGGSSTPSGGSTKVSYHEDQQPLHATSAIDNT